MREVPFLRHNIGAPEVESATKALLGNAFLTGEHVAQFEAGFSHYLGCKETVACASCTAAMHLALLALGLQPGDEVITTPMTFIATAGAIIQAGGTPVFADVDPATGNLDPAAAAAAITPRTKGLLLVHLYGQMCDMRAFRALADRHNLFIVEDAAHCVEGERDGLRPAALGHIACFSFHAMKHLASGEGGAAVTNDPALAAKMRLMRTHGINKTPGDRLRNGYQHWDMVCFGWPYTMADLHAAILLPQLPHIHTRWTARQALANHYLTTLRDLLPHLGTPARLPGRHANGYLTVWVPPAQRDPAIPALLARGVSAFVAYRPIHLLTYFQDTLHYPKGSLPNAETIGHANLALPFYTQLSHDDATYTLQALRHTLQTLPN